MSQAHVSVYLSLAVFVGVTCGCRAGNGPAGDSASSVFAIKPYLRSPGQTEMTVAWTSTAQASFVLKYGEGKALDQKLEVSALPEPIEYLPRPEPGSQPTEPDAPKPPAPEKLKEYQYIARLTGLRPGTDYRYEVSTAGQKCEGTFRTFPEQHEDFVFIACADSQNPSELRRIAACFAQWNPRFIIHAGDMLENGHFYEEWNRCFFAPLDGVVNQVPLMPARGNHDGREFIKRIFAFPEERFYYSFDYANAHFVALDSGLHGEARQAMLDWCDKDLAASNADWKIVYYHHPSYDAGANEPDCSGRKDLVPILRKHAVALVFGGHTHAYQRFLPMFTKGENETHPITFMVIGGAGGSPMRVSQDPYLAAARSANHYVVVHVSKNTLTLRAMDLDGGVIDAFEIRRNADGSLDKDYCAKAVPEDGYGVLRKLVAPCLQGLTLSDDLRTGRAAAVKLNLAAGDQAMKFTVQLERRAQRVYEMAPVSGEVAPGEQQPLELFIKLRQPEKYAAPNVPLAVLRLECIFEIGGQRASVFSNRLVWRPPPTEATGP